ncbi:MAG: surface-adhesin E family protein [Saezia sp.]
MMKKQLWFLLLAVLLTQLMACQNTNVNTLPQTVGQAQDEWVLIFEDQITVYIQPSSITTHPQNKHWRSFDLLLNIPMANPPSSVAHYTFDCVNKVYRPESIDFYSAPHGRGEIQYTIAPEANLFLPMSSQSYIKTAVFPLVCVDD